MNLKPASFSRPFKSSSCATKIFRSLFFLNLQIFKVFITPKIGLYNQGDFTFDVFLDEKQFLDGFTLSRLFISTFHKAEIFKSKSKKKFSSKLFDKFSVL